MAAVTHDLPGDVHIAADTDVLMADLAAHLMTSAVKSVRDRGWFHLALSGGKSPEPFYVRLVTDPLYRGVPWTKTHVWMVDERMVAPDHEASNFRMIRETLLEHLPMRRRQWHPMPVEGSGPAKRYAAELRSVLGEEGRLDFAVLGMGADGHTASLFPGSPSLEERSAAVVESEGPGTAVGRRLTLTLPCLNACRQVAVLVTGEGKAAAIRTVADGHVVNEPDFHQIPMGYVNPHDGALNWFLDEAAASRL